MTSLGYRARQYFEIPAGLVALADQRYLYLEPDRTGEMTERPLRRRQIDRKLGKNHALLYRQYFGQLLALKEPVVE